MWEISTTTRHAEAVRNPPLIKNEKLVLRSLEGSSSLRRSCGMRGDWEKYSWLSIQLLRCGSAIPWQSKRQSAVTHSKLEAEYIDLSEAARGAAWLERSLEVSGI